MPSRSLQRWQTDRLAALDEIEAAHRSIGGSGPGRRYATEQINHAYAVLLSSQFQGFCRDLHLECVEYLVQGITPPPLRRTCRGALVQKLALDRGNPNPGNIGSDFNRLGLAFWPEVHKLESRNQKRLFLLDDLNLWRNAIAHQDFDPQKLGGMALHLSKVRKWRRACDQLATHFDEVMRQHIASILGAPPW